MLKNTAHLLFVLYTFQLHAQSSYCSPSENELGEQWYQVTAPSGLILREGPGRNTAKLASIPFEEEVRACAGTGIAETIEGQSGYWLKVNWADQTGYLFGGFLREIYKRKIQFLIPNAGVDSEWDGIQLSSAEKWQALVKVDTSETQRKRNTGRMKAINLKMGPPKEHSGNKSGMPTQNVVLNATKAPFAVFSGFKLAEEVENQIKTPIKLMPGEVANFNTYDQDHKLARRYTIAVEGKVVANPKFAEGSFQGPIDHIEHYQINLFEKEEQQVALNQATPWNVQRLADETVAGNWTMEMHYLFFAGDLDGDHELDLILATYGEKGAFFHLYLSSKKLPGFLLRYVAFWGDSDC